MSWDTELAADAPRSWWRYDDTSGLAVPDFGSDGNDGTLAGTIQQVGASGHRDVRATDRSVRLPYFDGADSSETGGGYMEADPGVFGTPSSWTIEAVVWPDGPPPSDHALRIFTLANNDGSGDGYICAIGSSGVFAAAASNGNYVPGVTGSGYYEAAGGEVCWVGWNHLVATYTAGTISVYVRGDLEDTAAVPDGLLYHGSRRLLVGRQNKEEFRGNRWFDGKISEVAIYDYALSADRIAAHAATAPWCRSSGWIVGAAALG